MIIHWGRKYFCSFYLQTFSTEEILKCHIKDCFEINGKQRIKMLKKVNTLNSNIMKGKQNHHLWFMQNLEVS